jgi:hypothetical protein
MTESPFSTQGWNRYSYVGNSPLNFTDPSGYCFLGCFWKPIFKAVGNFFKQSWKSLVQIAAVALICGPGAPVCAGLVTTFVTGVTSGDLGLALKSGLIASVTAAAFQGVGDLTKHGNLDFLSETHVANIAGHAAVGCGSAVASGGNCGAGALSGAAGSFAGPLMTGLNPTGKLIATSVVGGVASVAGGGKFANGAVTAAFGYLFNEVALSCRGIPAVQGTSSHCGLFVFDRNADGSVDIRAQFSFAGSRPWGGLGADQFNTDSALNWWDREGFLNNSGSVYDVTKPDWMSQSDFDAAVIRDARAYRIAPELYSVWGPNSNSAAAYPIFINGGSLPAPTTMPGWPYGAVGLDYWDKYRGIHGP